MIMHALASLEGFQSATVIAKKTQVSQTAVSKLLKQLAERGLLNSHQGVSGGYKLQRDTKHITVADIIETIDGPIGMTECTVDESKCCQAKQCGVKHHWQIINQVVSNALHSLTLHDMLTPLSSHSFKLTVEKGHAHDAR